MIVVNNDVTLESLLCRAQKGEVTLLAQAKEDGTFILVENTTTQQETRETAAAEESAVQTSHEADSIMQSADDSINTNAVSADTTTAVNDDGEIQHNIAKEERKTDVTSKICKIQEDGGHVVSEKFEQQNVNDLVVEAVPSGIVDQQGSNDTDIAAEEKDIDNDDVMDKTDHPETEVAFEDDMPAKTKCTAQSEVETVAGLQRLEVTSSIVKRLRQRSGMY